MHVFLTSNHWFPLKFSTHNVALSLEKNPNQERNVHRSITVYKQKQSKAVLNKYVGGVWCERTTAFSAGRHYYVLWTCIFVRRNVQLKCLDGFVAYINTAFWLHITLTDELEQGSSNLILEGRCPAEFSSNLPQHTCLEVSSSKSLISCCRCVWFWS